MAENEIKALVELHNAGNFEEFKEAHETNQDDYEETPDCKFYYLKLYAEVFDRSRESSNDSYKKNLTPEEKLILAYDFMQKAQERDAE